MSAEFDPGMCDGHFDVADDFEAAYADEFELLNAIEDEVNAPGKKALELPVPTPTSNKRPHAEGASKKPAVSNKDVSTGNALDISGIDELDSSSVAEPECQSIAPEQSAAAGGTQRKKARLDYSDTSHKSQAVPSERAVRRSQIYHVPPVGVQSSHVTLTSRYSHGTCTASAAPPVKYYLPVMDEQEYECEVGRKNVTVGNVALLSVPVTQLKLQLIREARNRQLLEPEVDNAEGRRAVELDSEDENDKENRAGSDKSDCENLWVEKYKPRHYVDLLSDDGINRTLLHWLKLWDKVVFNIDRQTLKVLTEKKEKKLKEQGYQAKRFLPEVKDELDKHGRPSQKVSLLAGPPGLGKTTLAHIIAKHAGYNVIEMNASDDRSASVFKNKLEDATQMKSVLGDDPRPNCLIIDEIDGAPKAAITMLLNAVNGGSSGGEGDQRKRSKAKGKEHILKRPIICICNDLYAPALKTLRQIALILQFPQTDGDRLITRLYDICYKEKIKADSVTLMALSEKTNNDIRSCINTLQFVRNKHNRSLNLQDVRSMEIGQKDSHKPLFSIWQELFHMPAEKRMSKQDKSLKAAGVLNCGGSDLVGKIQGNCTDITVRCHNMLQLVQSSGEYDKLLQGVFENYLSVKFKDPGMKLVNKGLEWTCFMDLVSNHIHESQNYIFMKYLPYGFPVMHLLYASKHYSKLSYPHSFFEAFSKTLRNKQTVQALFNELAPRLKEYVNETVLIREVLPYFLHIIQPALRPVSSELYSARERQDLANVVGVMIAYNVTYRQERTADGDYTYVLEPNVEDVVRYGTTASTQRQLTYNSKQMIAREILIEKLRRNERFRGRQPADTDNKKKVDAQPDSCSTEDANKVDDTTSDANVVKRKMEKSVGEFLVITPRNRENSDVLMMGKAKMVGESKDSDNNLKVSNMWYQYNEGINNAVRTPMYVRDFL